MKKVTALFLVLLLGMGPNLQAADPLQVYIEVTTGTGQTYLIGGTNVENVIRQVIERQGELAAIAGEPFVAQLNYLGVPDSAILSVSADGKSATLEVPAANFKKNFSATSPDKLNSEVQNFIRKDGSKQLAEMRRQVNKESPVGITDGNPNSTTALTASAFFDALALNPNRKFGDEVEKTDPWRLSFHGSGGTFNASAFHGWIAGGRLQLDYQVHRKLSIVGIMPFNFVNIGGSQVYGIGGGLGVPIAVIGNFDERTSRWTLAPFVGGMFRWSEDLAGGGALVTAGINSALSFPLGENWEPALIFQISDYRGVPFDIDGYELDKVVDQQVLKLGGQLVYRFEERLLGEIYGVANRFLQDAAVQDWATFGVGLRMRLWKSWSLGGGYELNTGPDYNANGGRITLGYRF